MGGNGYGERGFTLVELLVVVLIIGILAAIALPTFLGQRDKASDAAVKQDVRNAVSQMESCFRTDERYSGCPDTEHPLAAGVEATVAADGKSYVIDQRSQTGTTFSIERTGSRFIHGCTAAGVGGCRSGGSW